MSSLQRERRVLVVVGTRPEAIKMAPVLRELRTREGIDVRLALTGQHSDLVDEVLTIFSLVPEWDLEIMREGQTPAEVGRACLTGIERILSDWRPDLILVQGDTASVFFSALASFLHRIPCGHVEAGLRSGDLHRPFPEEGFRRLTGVIADLHFAPTSGARQNLLNEGIPADRIEVTGNTIVDALLDIASRSLPASSNVLARLLREDSPPFILMTAHRRESFGTPMEELFRTVREVVEEEGIDLLFPVHPNPQVVEPAHRILGGHPRIHLVPPLSYSDLVLALQGAIGVLTDSGGIQEEAPTFGTPVLVLRDVTERPEGVEAGVASLVGTDSQRIREATRRIVHEHLSTNQNGPGRRALGGTPKPGRPNPYGDGNASGRIADRIERFLTVERPLEGIRRSV